MSAPIGSDASTDAGASTLEAPADVETDDAESGAPDAADISLDVPSDRTDATDSLAARAADWASHWRAWGIALLSLLVVGWAVVRPERSPSGYIPIFVAFAALAVGYVYLDEETQIRFASA